MCPLTYKLFRTTGTWEIQKKSFFNVLTVTSIFQLNSVAIIFYLECSGRWCNGRRGDLGVEDGGPPARSRDSPGWGLRAKHPEAISRV